MITVNIKKYDTQTIRSIHGFSHPWTWQIDEKSREHLISETEYYFSSVTKAEKFINKLQEKEPCLSFTLTHDGRQYEDNENNFRIIQQNWINKDLWMDLREK